MQPYGGHFWGLFELSLLNCTINRKGWVFLTNVLIWLCRVLLCKDFDGASQLTNHLLNFLLNLPTLLEKLPIVLPKLVVLMTGVSTL